MFTFLENKKIIQGKLMINKIIYLLSFVIKFVLINKYNQIISGILKDAMELDNFFPSLVNPDFSLSDQKI
jgi:hypothetical protein